MSAIRPTWKKPVAIVVLFCQAEDGIRYHCVTGVQTCALPISHREPFIFVDRVVELIRGESARCVKRFAASEPFFRGHFPGDPLVPGVLLTEALAQTAGKIGRASCRERV